MIEITKDIKQVVLNKDDQRFLRIELERAFCLLDTTTPNSMYSGERINDSYQKLFEFYMLLNA